MRSFPRSLQTFAPPIAIGLAAIPPLLVILDRWAGYRLADALRPLWCAAPALCNSAWPPYFLIVFVSTGAVFWLVALAGARRIEGPEAVEARLLRCPGRHQRSWGLVMLIAGVTGAAAMIWPALLSGKVVSGDYALPLGIYFIGWLLYTVPLPEAWRLMRQHWASAGACLLGLLGISVSLFMYSRGGGISAISLVLLALAAAGLYHQRRRISVGYWLLLLALVAFTLQLNAWYFSFIGDEYAFYDWARGLALAPKLQDLQQYLFNGTVVYAQHPFLSSLLQAITVRLFDDLNFGWRYGSIAASAFSVLLFYYFFRVFLGRWVAFTAAFFIATSHFLMSFSRIGYNSTQALLAMGLAFACAAWAVRSRNRLGFVLTGAAIAFCFYVFPAALYVPPIVLWMLLCYLPPSTRTRAADWLALILSALLPILPLLDQPQYWSTRLAGTAITGTNAGPAFSTLAQHVLTQLGYAFYYFLYIPQETHYVTTAGVDGLTALLALLGIGVLLHRARRERFAFFVLSALAILLLLAGASHEYDFPPTTRMFLLIPWWALIAAIGLQWLAEKLALLAQPLRFRQGALAAVLVFGLALNLYQAYDVSARRSAPRYQYFESLLVRLAHNLASHPATTPQSIALVYDASQQDAARLQQILRLEYLPTQLQPIAVPNNAVTDVRNSALGLSPVVVVSPRLPEAMQAAYGSMLHTTGRSVCQMTSILGEHPFSVWYPSSLSSPCTGPAAPGSVPWMPLLGLYALGLTFLLIYQARIALLQPALIPEPDAPPPPAPMEYTPVMSATELEGRPARRRASLSALIQRDTWARLLIQPRTINILLLVVCLIAAGFRFYGLNWDSGRHLHPDERFLSTVTNDLRWPQNFSQYFDPNASSLSPYTNPNMGLFVYGTFPVYLVKWVSVLLDRNNYDQITIVGRVLSGIFDIGALLVLFLIGRRLYGKTVGLLAAALLALSVLDIQLSHFYAVDTYANLFIVATMYFLLVATSSGKWVHYLLTGLMLGFGLASKISVFMLAVPIVLGVGLDFYRRSRTGDLRAAIEQTLVRALTVGVAAMLVFRVLQPIAFAGPGFWNWSFNPRWIKDIVEQQKTVNGDADLPWVQQWTNRSMAFPLYNMLVWGLGLPLGLASLAGYVLVVYELVRRKRLEHLLPVAYVSATFVYHAATFVKFMRYFLPLYPFLALFAAYFIVWLWQRAHLGAAVDAGAQQRSFWHRAVLRLQSSRWFAAGVAALVVAGTLLYALAFSSIYSRTNTRVEASRWIYQHIPAGSVLADEHWDDWLPIGGLDGKVSYGDQGMFKSVEMANYEDDTPFKLEKMVNNLATADYLILSSNRLYDSIPRLPMRYPMTTRYYQLLFAGKLGYQRIEEFTSYPSLLGIQIPDQQAEEAFSVYDHPRVQIFKKTSDFNAEQVRHLLGDGIDWQAVVHLTPRQASEAPNALQLSPALQSKYQQASITSSAEVNDNTLGNRAPVLGWIIVLELMGLFALPVAFIAFRGLADRGYGFAKAIGLLVVGWGAWLVASLRLAPFTWWAILMVFAALGAASAYLANRRWDQLHRFIVARWRLLAVEELLFWIFFAGLLAIRMHNPDLWHPAMGGEKPMDLAYLTAIVRTPYFPSYDPWFSGGYINYYYFGMVLVATLIHLTGIVPTTAYNLAVPTFFALTGVGGFVVALSLADGLHNARPGEQRHLLGVSMTTLLAGLCGALFVVVMGNLAQVKLLWDAVISLGSVQPNGAAVVGTLPKLMDGLSRWLSGEHLPIHTEWWYWNATRVIPAGEGEAGPINEMPFFTFLFGDLHAHMLALPYTLLAIGLSLSNVRGARQALRPWWRDIEEILLLGLLALTIGALWPMNTWDFPTYTLLAGAALMIREIARRRGMSWAGLWAAAWRFFIVVAVGWMMFMPFHQSYASAYFGADLWKGSQTPLWAYLLIHGFFLFIIASYLVSELLYGRGHNAVVRSVQITLRNWRRRERARVLFLSLAKPKASYSLSLNLSQLAVGTALAIFVLRPVIGLALLLALLAALLLFSRRPDSQRQLLLSMIGLGLLLTAAVEVVVLRGDISRMNTVFKFYLQVWVMWGVSSAAVLPLLAQRLRLAIQLSSRQSGLSVEKNLPAASGVTAPRGVGGAAAWWAAFGLLVAACALYPITATAVRVNDRFVGSQSVTLDGTAYMRTSVYEDQGRPITLEYDREATAWLRQNVHGIPTILEANTPLYRWGSRVSIYTGLPTVIGWDWHQKQQRSVLPGGMIEQRIADVRTIYNTTDANQALELLRTYRVSYIYVGQLERLYYDPGGLQKFSAPNPAWTLVYQNAEVQIYKVH